MLSLPLLVVLSAWTCEQEDARVRAHLEDAYAQLEHAVPEGLTLAQRQGRAAALSRLRAYLEAGRFPRTRRDHPATPVFVDETDTHCAMGQLLAELGAQDVVSRVRRERNLGTVPQLAAVPGLGTWLDSHGMTAEEAALVQPTYFYCQPMLPCGLGNSVYDTALSRDAGEPFWSQTVVRTLGNSYFCTGESRLAFADSELVWPPDTVLGMPTVMAEDDLGWVNWVDANCAQRPHATDADRLIQDERSCLKTLAQRDLRWAAIECFHSGWQLERIKRCNPDGRFRSALFPPRGTMLTALTTWLARNNLDLADAGIDAATYNAMEQELWELSDDGGTPLDAGVRPVRTWDGGTVALDQACVDARDAGRADAGALDAGARDAGVPDAGVPDAGVPDAGVPDPGVQDAGVPDAGVPDAGGADAGALEPTPPVGCGCASLDLTACAWALVLLVRRRGAIRC